jgi:hypothetical protein
VVGGLFALLPVLLSASDVLSGAIRAATIAAIAAKLFIENPPLSDYSPDFLPPHIERINMLHVVQS